MALIDLDYPEGEQRLLYENDNELDEAHEPEAGGLAAVVLGVALLGVLAFAGSLVLSVVLAEFSEPIAAELAPAHCDGLAECPVAP